MRVIPGFSYLIAGGADILPELRTILEKEGVISHGSVDVFVHEYRQFKIADARALRERADLRAMGGRGRVFIVVSATFYADAQNALLKTLEEPRAGATFFFIVPSPETLLPTLRSRLQTLALGGERDLRDARAFLKATPEARIELLKPLYTHDEDDERDIRAATDLLQGIEVVLSDTVNNPAARDGIRAIYRARRYLADKGALLKPLLEQVALLAPRM